MNTGTVERLDLQKGYGFIKDTSGTMFFFHRSVVTGTLFSALKIGQLVVFEATASIPDRGPRCERVALPEG